MSSALYAMGRWAVDRRRTVVVFWLVGLVAVAALAALFGRGTTDTFSTPGTERHDVGRRRQRTWTQRLRPTAAA